MSITDKQASEARKLTEAGVSIREAAKRLDLNYHSLYGKLVKRERSTAPAHTSFQRVERVDDTHAIRFSDYPDTITAAVFGDPPPDRLRYIHGDKVQ